MSLWGQYNLDLVFFLLPFGFGVVRKHLRGLGSECDWGPLREISKYPIKIFINKSVLKCMLVIFALRCVRGIQF